MNKDNIKTWHLDIQKLHMHTHSQPEMFTQLYGTYLEMLNCFESSEDSKANSLFLTLKEFGILCCSITEDRNNKIDNITND